LQRSIAKQEKEKIFFLTTQTRANKTNKKEKRKDAYFGPAWVQLQPQLPSSNSSNSRHSLALATAPVSGSLSLDDSRALAME